MRLECRFPYPSGSGLHVGHPGKEILLHLPSVDYKIVQFKHLSRSQGKLGDLHLCNEESRGSLAAKSNIKNNSFVDIAIVQVT